MQTEMSRRTGIAETSNMLLSGWKLLSDSCPICHFALMSKSGIVRCPNCAADVITETEYENRTSKVAKNNVKDDSEFYSDGEDDFDDDTDIALQYSALKDDFRKKQDIISSKLGAKMMQGWALLAHICPKDSCRGTPLMKLNGGGFMQCVSCDEKYELSSTNDLIEIHENEINITVDTNNKTVYNPDLLNNASDAISKKLLCGWTLLSDICHSATCNGDVPLMKDLSGNIICVYCESRYNDAIISDTLAPSTEPVVNKNSSLILPEDQTLLLHHSISENNHDNNKKCSSSSQRLIKCSENILNVIEKSCERLDKCRIGDKESVDLMDNIPKLCLAYRSVFDASNSK